MEGEFCHGRTNALCDSPERWREYGYALSRIPHFSQDRIQDLYPLTVTDHASRYLLLREAMQSNKEQPAFTAFKRLLLVQMFTSDRM